MHIYSNGPFPINNPFVAQIDTEESPCADLAQKTLKIKSPTPTPLSDHKITTNPPAVSEKVSRAASWKNVLGTFLLQLLHTIREWITLPASKAHFARDFASQKRVFEKMEKQLKPLWDKYSLGIPEVRQNMADFNEVLAKAHTAGSTANMDFIREEFIQKKEALSNSIAKSLEEIAIDIGQRTGSSFKGEKTIGNLITFIEREIPKMESFQAPRHDDFGADVTEIFLGENGVWHKQ